MSKQKEGARTLLISFWVRMSNVSCPKVRPPAPDPPATYSRAQLRYITSCIAGARQREYFPRLTRLERDPSFIRLQIAQSVRGISHIQNWMTGWLHHLSAEMHDQQIEPFRVSSEAHSHICSRQEQHAATFPQDVEHTRRDYDTLQDARNSSAIY